MGHLLFKGWEERKAGRWVSAAPTSPLWEDVEVAATHQGGLGNCLCSVSLVLAASQSPLVFRSWQVWETGHLPGSSHAIPPDNRTVPDSSHGSGSPVGLCSSQWDLAGVSQSQPRRLAS